MNRRGVPSPGDVLRLLGAQRVVPVLRNADAADAVATARACARGGARVVELTCSTPDVERAIAELAGDEGMVVGLGTIADAVRVAGAVAAGARFVVSYTAPPGFVAAAREAGVLAIPGAFTPTEVAACARDGARAVKLFPARALGPAVVRDLRTVLPGVPLLVTGGIGARAQDVAPWLEAGALAVGLGGALGTAAADGAGEVERRLRAALGHPA
ncbi:MAG: bifunctional 4-hydroxy-2-oxoglutarate aldolase/2-dehydro-3-deoxy-phosphogluconate aldolase [Thermoleophilia bacterium]|nr:bifunctional 4-hydroxy-2-oxoglutarate aldolase/2-dehydro-3-deoxy-phosphogluconate aldolase [Thermoleophilia bacterium]